MNEDDTNAEAANDRTDNCRWCGGTGRDPDHIAQMRCSSCGAPTTSAIAKGWAEFPCCAKTECRERICRAVDAARGKEPPQLARPSVGLTRGRLAKALHASFPATYPDAEHSGTRADADTLLYHLTITAPIALPAPEGLTVGEPVWHRIGGAADGAGNVNVHEAHVGRLTLRVGSRDGIAWWTCEMAGVSPALADNDIDSDSIATAKRAAFDFACSLVGARPAPAREGEVSDDDALAVGREIMLDAGYPDDLADVTAVMVGRAAWSRGARPLAAPSPEPAKGGGRPLPSCVLADRGIDHDLSDPTCTCEA